MEQIMELVSNQRSQYLVFIGLSIGVAGLIAIVYSSSNLIFQRFLGRINPFVAFLFVFLLGLFFLSYLLSQGWFAIYENANLTGLLRSSGLAALLGLIMILVDLKIVFPADTNVSFPESVLFYPAIGFVAEILFHVLPLSVLLISLTSIFKNIRFDNVIWICIPIVALVEPIYQAAPMASSDRYPLWAIVYVGLHIFLINLFQLLIFKRYDFITMYSFRLVYYLFWHIGWGYMRLRLLF
jgi:hypothetical protein